MISTLKCVLILALISIFIDSSKTQHFCQSFAENDYNISYGFRRITKSDAFKSYVFIDQNYWKLIYTDSEGDNKTVHLMSEESKKSNWFGNQFSAAFCVWFNHSCKLDKKSITWGLIDESEEELILKKISDIKAITFESYSEKNSIAFVPSAGHMTHKLVVFYKPTAHNTYEVFEIYDNMTAQGRYKYERQGFEPDLDYEPIVLHKLINGIQVIAVMGQYSALHKTHGMIILFKFDKSIKYCYTDTKIISRTCTHTPKLLIDCSKTVIEATVSPPVSQKYSNLFGIIFVVLVVMAFAAIITILWYYRTYQNKQNDTKSDKSTETLEHLPVVRTSESTE